MTRLVVCLLSRTQKQTRFPTSRREERAKRARTEPEEPGWPGPCSRSIWVRLSGPSTVRKEPSKTSNCADFVKVVSKKKYTWTRAPRTHLLSRQRQRVPG